MAGMKKRKRSVDESAALSKEEKERRQKQRELRNVALELRAKGIKYNPHKHGNKKPATPKKNKKRIDAHTDADTERPHKPRRAPQVIVIPIYWNTKQQEKDAVIAAARTVVEGIANAGIKVGLDTTNTHTPGSKFRYWEERGCKYRVELGPQDVAKGTAVLAICGTPGEVAEKHTLAAPEAVVARLMSLIGGGGHGNDKAADGTKGVAADGQVVEQAPAETKTKEKKKKEKVEQPMESTMLKKKNKKAEEPPGGSALTKAPPPVSKTPGISHWGGGDDAEDDFGIDLLAVQNPPAVHKGRKGRRFG